MKNLNILNQVLRMKWILLSFLLFTWLMGSWILNSAFHSQEKVQLSQTLELTNALVVSRLQFLQLELGHFLSEELSVDQRSSVKMSEFQSPPKKFAGLGVVKQDGGKLTLEKFFYGKDAKLTEEFIQEQLDWVNPTGRGLGQQGYFWVDRGPGHVEYLFSFLPYELEGKDRAWGLGVSRVPTTWLELPGAKNAFLVEKQTGQILSAFGGANQGGDSEAEVPARLSASEIIYTLGGEESRALQAIPGTNLILLLKEPVRAAWTPLTIFIALSLVFLIGLLFLSSSMKEQEEELIYNLTDREPVKVTVREEPIPEPLVVTPVAATPAPVAAEPMPAAEEIASRVEDQLIETILNTHDQEVEDFGYRVADRVSELMESLSSEIQKASVRVNLMVPEDVRSNWPQTQLNTALEEIVKNSLEAMESSETKTLTFTASLDGVFVDLVVEDTGVGMSEKVLERSLEAFYSTKPALNKRRGLGLNVAKRLLEVSGGSLDIQSIPGMGTRVSLRFLKEYEDELDNKPPKHSNNELNG